MRIRSSYLAALSAAACLALTAGATPAHAAGNQYNIGVTFFLRAAGQPPYCLDIPNNHAVVGAQLQAMPCDGSDEQGWNKIYTDSYHFELQSWTDGNLCANNWQGGDVSGNDIKLYNCNSDADGTWNTVSYGSYTQIQPRSAVNTCLNIWGGLGSGNPARLFQCGDVPNEDVTFF